MIFGERMGGVEFMGSCRQLTLLSSTPQHRESVQMNAREGKNVRRHLIQRMEDQAVPPHGDGDGVVAEGEAICADEEALGLREEPYGEDQEEVNEVAEVGEKVVEANFVVVVPANWHEVAVRFALVSLGLCC